jgi:hypothetical protein
VLLETLGLVALVGPPPFWYRGKRPEPPKSEIAELREELKTLREEIESLKKA